MAKNFYNLPSPWNPGFAMPESVMDEGLERRAFTTVMTPRGTYDDPSVGNAGFAVPRYIDDEGYGQGAFVTKWLPRGYYGPELPNYLDQTFSKIVGESPASGNGVVLKMETLGDDAPGYATSAPRDQFQQFGRRSAAALMSQMDRLPEKVRPARMRQALDAMDPRLYQRTLTYADRLRRIGAKPRAALAHGLAAGITEGMLKELARSGASRTAPQAHSLPGLGCYGCDAALGAITTMSSQVGSVVAQGPVMVSCPGYSYDGTKWTRARAGQPQNPGPLPCPTQNSNQGVIVTETASGQAVPTTVSAPPPMAPMAQIGPWVFPLDGGTIHTHMKSVPAAWGTFVGAQIELGAKKIVATQRLMFGTATNPGLAALLKSMLVVSIDGGLIGKPGQKVNVLKQQIDGSFPLVKVMHPTKKKWWALYLQDLGQNGDGSFVLRFREMETNWLNNLFSWLAEVVAKVVDVVKEAIATVAGLACQLVNQPGATAAAAAASGGTAAVGVAIASGFCQTPAPIPIPPPPSSSDLAIPIAIGAGAIGIALLLKNRKKKA